jgi:1-aminocyclopropane-1-carboxylate deaminase
MNPEYLSNSFIQRIEYEAVKNSGVVLDVKRLDAIHPHVQGNKWFKLKYNIEHVMQSEHRTLLTFGGAWSNHIYSTAAAGKLLGFKTIGIIRGEEPHELSPTLQFARACGMQLEFITRFAYAEKETEDFKSWLHDTYGSFHLVPEGGSNFAGINGCMEILSEEDKKNYDFICCAAGTGATIAGILLSIASSQKVITFPVFKDGSFMSDTIQRHLQYFLMDETAVNEYMQNFRLCTDYGFGGYAKWNDELIEFIQKMKINQNLPLDQIYTGKMFFGVLDIISKGYFPEGSRILAIHTGGLQGSVSKSNAFIKD